MYQKGEYKKDIILKNAKELFYKKGYSQTTIKEIASMSQDPISLVHYYFKRKEDIIRQAYIDFQGSIDLFVYSRVPDADENIFLAHSLNNRIYYDIILNDPNNIRVYAETLKSSSNAKLIGKYAFHIYQKYLEQFHISLPYEVFRAYVMLDFGARREFFTEYFNGNIRLEIQEAVDMIAGMFPRMVKQEPAYVDAVLEKSYEIFQTLDFSKLKFLI